MFKLEKPVATLRGEMYNIDEIPKIIALRRTMSNVIQYVGTERVVWAGRVPEKPKS